MNWRFFLDAVEVDEPIGWDGMTVSMVRDNKWHGVMSEYSFKGLQFLCDGFAIIQNKYETEGLDAEISLEIEYSCDGVNFIPFWQGRLLVSELSLADGEKLAEVNIEDATMSGVLRAREETPVDLLKTTCLDEVTLVQPFTNGVFPAQINSNVSSQILYKQYKGKLNGGIIKNVISRSNGLFVPCAGSNSPDCDPFIAGNQGTRNVGPSLGPHSAATNVRQWSPLLIYQIGEVVFIGSFYRKIAVCAFGGIPGIDPCWDLISPFDYPTELALRMESLIWRYENGTYFPAFANCGGCLPGANPCYTLNCLAWEDSPMSMDPGGVLVTGSGFQTLTLIGWAAFTAQTVLNETPITQPTGLSLVAGYFNSVEGIWNITDGAGVGCPTNSFPKDGEQASSPPTAIYVCPEDGDYTVKLECEITTEVLFAAITDATLRSSAGGTYCGCPKAGVSYENDFYRAQILLRVEIGGTTIDYPYAGPQICGRHMSDFAHLNATDIKGWIVNVNINAVYPLLAGDEVKIYYVGSICGEWAKDTGGTTPVNGIIMPCAEIGECCFLIQQGDTFSTSADSVISLFAPNEVWARVVDNITNGQATFQSDLFGRPDSEPFASVANGCASLAALTNGYLIRGYALDGAPPPPPLEICDVTQGGGTSGGDILIKRIYFSLKELFDNFDSIFCIGLGVDGNVVRVEPRKYFYSDTIVITLDAGDKVILGTSRKVDAQRIFSEFRSGYSNYKADTLNGLNEFNTTRLWYLPIKSYKSRLERSSEWVASGYTFEETRRQNVLIGGTTDWDFDENNFILQLEDLNPAPSDSLLERGVGGVPANILDPASQINWRLRPSVMARRWLAWLSQTVFHNPALADWLKLASGGMNILAAGSDVANPNLPDPCDLTEQLAENKSLDLANAVAVAPDVPNTIYMRPEVVNITMAISLDEYATIRANPYGLIGFIFDADNGGTFTEYFWLKSLDYNPTKAEAQFRLIPRYIS